MRKNAVVGVVAADVFVWRGGARRGLGPGARWVGAGSGSESCERVGGAVGGPEACGGGRG